MQLTSSQIQSIQPKGLDLDFLSFKIIDLGKDGFEGESETLFKAYGLWKRIWLHTFQELEGIKNIYSDDFLRQDEAFAIFYRDECIGITMHSFVDLDNPIQRDLKYFKAYPPGSLEAIRNKGIRHVLISNQTAVDHEFRKSLTGMAFGDILIGLSVRRLVESRLDAFIAYTNNSKKVQEICYRFGAKPIVKGHSQHNVEVDIVCLERQMATESSQREVNLVIDHLWSSQSQAQGEAA